MISLLNLGAHVADHVRSLGLLLTHVREQGAPIYAHGSLARGAVESTAWLSWLLADGDGFDARLGRGAAFLIDDAGLAVKAADQVSGTAYMPPPGAQEQARRERLLTQLDDARIRTDRAGPRVRSVRVTAAGPEHPTNVKISSLVAQAFAEQPALYSLLSGLVHGRRWSLMDNVDISHWGRRAGWRADPVAVSLSALVSLLAAQRAGELFAAYRGHPDDPAVVRMRRRHEAFDRQMVRYGRSAGMLDRIGPVAGLLIRE